MLFLSSRLPARQRMLQVFSLFLVAELAAEWERAMGIWYFSSVYSFISVYHFLSGKRPVVVLLSVFQS